MMTLKGISIRKKIRRGVTPVVATILLIGLVALAGMAVTMIIFATLTAPKQIDIEIDSITGFETTDNDTKIDKFVCIVRNKQSVTTVIKLSSLTITKVDVATNQRTDLSEWWYIDLSQDDYYLPAYSTCSFVIISSTGETSSSGELVPGDAIFISLDAYYEKASPTGAITFKSSLLGVDDTIGPVKLTTQVNSTTITSGQNIDLKIWTTNLGTTDLDLYFDFSISSAGSCYFTVNGVNATSYYFSLAGNTSESFTNGEFIIHAGDFAEVGATYFVYVSLWNYDSQQLIGFQMIGITYS